MAQEDKRMYMLSGTTSDWTANPIVMVQGEIGIEYTATETLIRVGDGIAAFFDLPIVSRQSNAEIDTLIDANITARSTAVSSGAPSAGLLPVLGAAGLLDVSMMPPEALGSTSLRILGAADMTLPVPAPPTNGYQSGDVYVGTTAGQYQATWAPLSPGVAEPGDVAMYDSSIPGWFMSGNRRLMDLPARDFPSDALAAGGGVPLGGLYHTSGAVKVRIV